MARIKDGVAPIFWVATVVKAYGDSKSCLLGNDPHVWIQVMETPNPFFYPRFFRLSVARHADLAESPQRSILIVCLRMFEHLLRLP